MKNILILLFLLPVISSSQMIDSVLSYYPLHTGNYWEYKHLYSYNGIQTEFFCIEVIGDTVMHNNIQYKVLRKNNIPDMSNVEYRYERVDSITSNTYRYFIGSIYQYEELQDSLQVQEGDSVYDSWRSNLGIMMNTPLVCTNVFDDSVLGIYTRIKRFEDTDIYALYHYELARDLGLIYEYDSFDMDLSIIYLLYARINGLSHGIPISIKYKEMPIPKFCVYQNYPNPFNSRTVIPFELPMAQNIEIRIFDLSGKEIFTLFKGRISEGYHELTVDGNNLASGVYYCQLKSQNYSQTKKLIILK